MRRGSQDALSICMSQSEYNGISMPVLEQKSWKCLACPPTSPQPLSRFRRGRLTKESGQKKKIKRVRVRVQITRIFASSCFPARGGPTLEGLQRHQQLGHQG